MIAKQNLMYELLGNSNTQGKIDRQDKIFRYLFRESDHETIGYKDLQGFLKYLEINVLKDPVELPLAIEFEHSWVNDRDRLIGEIYKEPGSDYWRYTTYYRQQKHSLTFTTIPELLEYIKLNGYDHRLTKFI